MSRALSISALNTVEVGATADQTKADIDSLGINRGRNNLIINGNMNVAQRANSATGLGSATGYFTLDRWNVTTSTTGRFTMSQSTDAPIGFSKSMKLDCTTADTSIAAGEYSILTQAIEAQNIQGMARGTSGAKEVTVSFYVKGNASTTYVCELQDGGGRELSKTFNVTTAWEKVELTFPADTNAAAAPTYDNTAGIYLYIWVQAGSTFSGGSAIPTSWANQSNANRCVGIDNFFSSTSNELYITGVQLEVGSVATDFEHRSYAENLLACQRYYEIIADGGYDVDHMFGIGHGVKSDQINWFYDFKAEKRAAFTLIVASVSNGYHAKNHSVYKHPSNTSLGMTATVQSLHSISAYMTSITGVTEQSAWTMQLNGAACHIAVSAEL